MQKAIVILACWCACGVVQAQAQTYYVSPQPGGGAVIYNMFDPVGQGGQSSLDRGNPVDHALDSYERTSRLLENNRRQLEERRRERAREIEMRQRGLVP